MSVEGKAAGKLAKILEKVGVRDAEKFTLKEVESGTKGAWKKELNKPLENTVYDVDGKFRYVTDAEGRVTHAETTLDRLTPGERNAYQQRVAGRGDRLPGDEGGHIFGTRFGGPGEGVNLTAMRRGLNGPGQASYYEMESQWAKAVEDGKPVHTQVHVEYGSGNRPTSYTVQYRIGNGRPITRVFQN